MGVGLMKPPLFTDKIAQMHTIEAVVAALLLVGAVAFVATSAPAIHPEFLKVQLQEYGEDTLQVLSIYPHGEEFEIEWWNDSWHYRIPVSVGAEAYRTDYPIGGYVYFMGDLIGTFDENSTRVIEYYANGTVKGETPSQFSKIFETDTTTLNIVEGWSYQDSDWDWPFGPFIPAMEYNDTVNMTDLDGNWAPTVVDPVTRDWYITGPYVAYWDAASVRFDLSEMGHENIMSATLRAYIRDGNYSSQYHHYDLYLGEKITTDGDDGYGGHDSFTDGMTGWIEHEVPINWITDDDLWLSLRLWDARVDRIELDVKYLYTDFDATTNAEGTIFWIMNGTTPANTDRYYYIYFDNTSNPKPPTSYPSSFYDDGDQTGGFWTCDNGNISFTYNLNDDYPGISDVTTPDGITIDTWDDNNDHADSFTQVVQGDATIKKLTNGSIYREYLLSAINREEYIVVYNNTDFFGILYAEVPDTTDAEYHALLIDNSGHGGYYDGMPASHNEFYNVSNYCWIENSGNRGFGLIMAEKSYESLFRANNNHFGFYSTSDYASFYIDNETTQEIQDITTPGYFWLHATDSGYQSTSRLADSLRNPVSITNDKPPGASGISTCKLAYYIENKDWTGLDVEIDRFIPDEIKYNFYVLDKRGEVIDDGGAKVEHGRASSEAVTVGKLVYADDPMGTGYNVYEVQFVLWYA